MAQPQVYIHPEVGDKPDDEQFEKSGVPVHLKSELDNLGLVQTAWRFRKAVVICTLLCFAAAADGYQINLNGNIIANNGFIAHIGHWDETAHKYVLNPQHTALWGAMQSLGQIIGMVGLSPISDRIGRKMTLYVLWLILAASLIIETLVQNWQQWAGAKLLAGVGVGSIQATLPIYITEWAPNNIRGGMITLYMCLNMVGQFLAPIILMIVKNGNANEFRIPIYTQWAFLAIMLPIFLWLPESPAYFVAKDQDDAARKVLRRVNGKVQGYDVEREFQIIKNTILEERAMNAQLGIGDDWKSILQTYVECFKGTNLRRTFAAALPASAGQLTGLSFLATYASLFFKEMGFSNAFEITSILYSVKIGAVLLLTLTTDRLGRRNVVIVLATTTTAMLLVVGIIGQVHRGTAANGILIAAACIWSGANICLGGLGWAFTGEVPSQRLRARTSGLSAAISVLFGLTFNTSVPIMLQTNGANWGFNTSWLFFGTGIISVALCVWLLPECARRNAAEIDEMYAKGVPAWRMKGYVTDVQREQAELH